MGISVFKSDCLLDFQTDHLAFLFGAWNFDDHIPILHRLGKVINLHEQFPFLRTLAFRFLASQFHYIHPANPPSMFSSYKTIPMPTAVGITDAI